MRLSLYLTELKRAELDPWLQFTDLGDLNARERTRARRRY